MKRFLIFALTAMMAMSFMSCIRPYDKPTFEEVDTYETAFLIPMLSRWGDIC